MREREILSLDNISSIQIEEEGTSALYFADIASLRSVVV